MNNDALRHRCRNPRCRLKLPAPVENPHHAFCCRGCHEGFYHRRCLVCEDDMIRKRADQRCKSGHARCAAEYRRFPRAFDYPGAQDRQPPVFSHVSPAEAHFTGLGAGLRAAPKKCLSRWRWTDESDLEFELLDEGSRLLARLEHNRGRYRLTHPRVIPGWVVKMGQNPVLSWADLGEAKHQAERVALGNLPLVAGVNIEKADRARINAANTRPNPMGPPLNRQPHGADGEMLLGAHSRIAEAKTDSGIDTSIPDFLRRVSP